MLHRRHHKSNLGHTYRVFITSFGARRQAVIIPLLKIGGEQRRVTSSELGELRLRLAEARPHRQHHVLRLQHRAVEGGHVVEALRRGARARSSIAHCTLVVCTASALR